MDSCGSHEPSNKKVKVSTCAENVTENPMCTNGCSRNGNLVAMESSTTNGDVAENMDNKNDSWAIDPNKKKEEFRNYTNSKRQATVDNFYKEQHSKMTFDLVMQKREQHLAFNKCVMSVWDMLHYLDQVVDDSDPDTDLTQIEHAIQTGEAARRLHPEPEYDWFHVTAFIHDLGKILAVKDASKNLKGEPQWCVVGDNWIIGCQFSQTNIFYDYFKNNPDFNNNKYNTFYGIYEPKCGLNDVYMSWGHDEYLYQIAKTQSKLPEQALYMLRFHSFYPWHNKHGYMHLCNDKDLENLKWVKEFQKCDLYSKAEQCPTLDDVADYYKSKLDKYFPEPVRW